ncbi:MAG TPA: hypothetical protein VFA16_07525 [Mycobacterium sp.]|uniref:hypothetical protein n=1 Tax=Mycobacterium sp. TaxID=1785 RepID=UPI002D3C0DDC|nr:hypothetical protein [Mycobacterium sp.]HZU47085.1 hypothetical protein [Mycobacterium sp.]
MRAFPVPIRVASIRLAPIRAVPIRLAPIRLAPIRVASIHWAARREAGLFSAPAGSGRVASVSETAAGLAAWEVCVAAAEAAAASGGRLRWVAEAAAGANLADWVGEAAVCAELGVRVGDSPPWAEALAAWGRVVQSSAARRPPAPTRQRETAAEAHAEDRRR